MATDEDAGDGRDAQLCGVDAGRDIMEGGAVSYHLGVDLGTTFVAAAVARGDRVRMAALGDRSVVMPAVLHAREDGALVTGEPAGRRLVSPPTRSHRTSSAGSVSRPRSWSAARPTRSPSCSAPCCATCWTGSPRKRVARRRA